MTHIRLAQDHEPRLYRPQPIHYMTAIGGGVATWRKQFRFHTRREPIRQRVCTLLDKLAQH